MKIVPMNDPRPGQRVQCVACYSMIDADKAFADLDAKAFTFYHNRCRPDNFEVRKDGDA